VVVQWRFRPADNSNVTNAVARIEGPNAIVAWFGHWPPCHDAEILFVHSTAVAHFGRIARFITLERAE
jgi:hypothetical protein